ncbi:hypothetical protein Amsp01_017900 [Amycolatopsis sp. NBRC 101858]|uniref:hypothetical protein n=1 Tax=Amycolatopsis sp. NBRC 101858 TaxID=3032200 RepID=UPI0024A20E21|nr:hypothetical protein [Amycolatopsis sp. NBRC 101858]GLY35766.1 hypothetical protein Amsp01_017900 [Amycolatopsis sp. NBRC 101858]
MARKQQGLPVLTTGSGFGRKLVGLVVLVALVVFVALVFVVSSPLEAAGHVRHVANSLTTFFSSL